MQTCALLDDAEVTRSVAALERVAHQLEHVTLVSRASLARIGGHNNNAAALTSAAANDAVSPRQRNSSVWREDATGWPVTQPPQIPSSTTSSPPLPQLSPSPAADEGTLQLPKSCGSETVAVLSELGQQLREATRTLMQRIEQQYVDLYEHMKQQQSSVLQELATRRRIAPSGFDMYTEYAATGDGGAVTADRQRPRSLSATSPRDAHDDGAAVHPLLVADGSTSHNATMTTTLPSGDATLTRPWRDGVATLHNAPLARRLNERRVAANTLQTFLHLLLEGALTQTDASCAAVYLCNETASVSAAAAAAAGGGAAHASSHVVTPRTAPSSARAATTTTAAAAAASTVAETAAAAADGAAPRHFLHCVASLNAHGRLPQDVSLASLNTLATVVQTGVAANLQQGGSGHALTRDVASGGGGGAAAAPRQPSAVARKGLDIATGVIVPIRNCGCVVLANKRLAGILGGSSDNGGGGGSTMTTAAAAAAGASVTTAHRHTDLAEGFSVSDEHVAWSVALACEALLARYERELLLDFAWSPSGVAVLRRHMKLARLSECAVDKRDDALPSLGKQRRAAPTSTTAATSATAEPLLLLPLPSLVAQSHHGGGPLPHALTIVRTADARLREVLPEAVLRPAHRPRDRATAHATTSLSDEDLFSAAAQYIANLESLWSQSLSENNTMQNVLTRFGREMDAKNDKIRSLEGKIRRLNAHIVQLERRVMTSMAGTTTTTTTTTNASGGVHMGSVDGT